MKKIIVIEDDVEIKNLYKLVLESEKYAVICFENALFALDHLKTQSLPDLILMDLNFPEMSVMEFIDNFNLIKGSENVKRITVSGDSDIDRISKELGFHDYISKPCELETLINTINKNIL